MAIHIHLPFSRTDEQKHQNIWMFPKVEVGPQNGWCIMVPNPIKMDDLGGFPIFLETSKYIPFFVKGIDLQDLQAMGPAQSQGLGIKLSEKELAESMKPYAGGGGCSGKVIVQ